MIQIPHGEVRFDEYRYGSTAEKIGLSDIGDLNATCDCEMSDLCN